MDNLIEILRDALQVAISRPGILRFPIGDHRAALSLLSDRSALLWALLEEMAGEITVVGYMTYLDVGGRVDANKDGSFEVESQIDDIEEARFLILCLARAIQEQKRREVAGE